MAKTYAYSFAATDRMSAPLRNIAGGLASANARLQTFSAGIRTNASAMGGWANRMASLRNLVVANVLTGQLQGVARAVTDTLGRFETMGAVLENNLGSKSAAQRVMSDITDFASRTPFQVDELTDSWVRLANQGFRPNMAQMTLLGDLAASTGKTFTQLSEAVLDAQVGEFERLKEFGIRAEKDGDRVRFTFKGITQEVAFGADSIQKYLLCLGQMQGVGGAMEKISGTIAGRISNFKDLVTQLQLTIGQELRPVIEGIVVSAQKFVLRLTELVKWVALNRATLWQWAKVIGVVGGAILGVVAAAKTLLLIQAMVVGVKNAFLLFAGVLRVVKIAQLALNLVMMMNPLGLLVIGITVAIVALVAITRRFDELKAFMVQLGEFLWNAHPFKWMIDLMDRVFPGFKASLNNLLKGVIDAFKQAWEWLHKNFFKPVMGALDSVFGKFFDFKPLAGMKDGGPLALGDGADPYATTPGGAGSKPGGGLNVSKGVNGVTGPTRQVKNITINIQKLNDGGININTSTLAMSTGQIKSEMERILLSVVNDVNYQ